MAKKKAMKKKSSKDTPKEPRQFGVILESMDKKIDFLVEGHQAHGKRFDRLEKRLSDEIGELRGEMNYKFGVVFDELHLIRTDLKNKADKDDLIALEKRVLALEKRSSSSK